jgi:AmmeMemoRadiSam system protein B
VIRKSVVAGVFYPSGKNMLIDTIQDLFLGPLGPGDVPKVNPDPLEKPTGLISPHAGYMYSGQVAAWGYHELARKGAPKTAILIGPNHTGYGPRVSVYPEGSWETPLGNVEIDEEAVRILLENSEYLSSDTSAHMMEHSLEVQIPFLQFLYGDSFKIVPIVLKDQSPEIAKDLSYAISRYLSLNHSTVVIASTDLNHYEDQETTLRKDKAVIEAIESQNPAILYSAVYELEISMCGYGAVATLMMLDLGKPRVLKHATSGDVSGDYLEVVGYLSVIYD